MLCPINAASWARSGQSEGLDLKAEGSKGKALCEGLIIDDRIAWRKVGRDYPAEVSF